MTQALMLMLRRSDDRDDLSAFSSCKEHFFALGWLEPRLERLFIRPCSVSAKPFKNKKSRKENLIRIMLRSLTLTFDKIWHR